MSLFELRVQHLVPPVGRGKFLVTNAIAEDGFDYAVKAISEHPALPFTEWFCNQLAQAMGLSCPSVAILVMPDGSRALGSRIEVGLFSLEDAVKNGTKPEELLSACAGRLSVAYAMDIFLGNVDRHFGNFLFRKNSLDRLSLMPIDYSHAWLARGWPPIDITQLACATTNHVQILLSLGLWRAPDALLSLGQLSQISVDRVERWIEDCPQQWVSAEQKAAIVTWWVSQDFHQRVSQSVAYCQP